LILSPRLWKLVGSHPSDSYITLIQCLQRKYTTALSFWYLGRRGLYIQLFSGAHP
jgi:hypothetical protein